VEAEYIANDASNPRAAAFAQQTIRDFRVIAHFLSMLRRMEIPNPDPTGMGATVMTRSRSSQLLPLPRNASPSPNPQFGLWPPVPPMVSPIE
jgi:hypothetical protein